MHTAHAKKWIHLLVVAVLAAGLPTAAVLAHDVATAEPAAAATTPVCSPAVPGGALPLDGTAQCGQLETQGADNEWTFHIDAPGAEVIFDLPDPSSDNDCRDWSLRDANQRPMWNPTALLHQDQRVVLAPGDYTLTATAQTKTPLYLVQDVREALSYCAIPYKIAAWRVPVAQSFDLPFPATGASKSVPADSFPVAGAPADTVDGNIESPGAMDIYRFTVPADGAVVSLDVGTESSSRQFILRDNQQRLVFESAFVDTYARFLPAGSYTLTVGYGIATSAIPATGTYGFTLNALANASASTYSGSTPDLPLNVDLNKVDGVAQAGAGNIEVLGGTDAYLFDVPVTTNATFAVSNGRTWLLTDPAGNVVYAHRQNDASEVLSLPAGDGYKITVAASDTFGAYTLSVVAGGATALVVDYAQPALAPPGSGVRIAGTIASGTRDLHALTGGIGGTRVRFEEITRNTGVTIDVRGPGGKLVTSQSASSQTWFTLPETATYAIIVRGSGNYAVDLQTAAAAAAPASLTLPTSTTLPITKTDAIDQIGGEDVFRFTATIGRRYAFTQAAGSNLDLVAELRDATGDEVRESWKRNDEEIAAGPFWAPLVFTVPRTGEYTLSLRGLRAAVGTYAFTTSLLSTPTPSGLTLTGPPVSGSLAYAGQQDAYTFVATAGKTLYFNGSTTGNPRYRFYGPNGQAAFTDIGVRPALYPRRSGKYTLSIDRSVNGTFTTLSYSFTLATAPDAQAFTVALPLTATGNTNPSLGTITDATGTRTAAGTGNIEAAGAEDRYRFNGSAGQQLSISLPGINTEFDFTLVDPDGFDIGRNGGCVCTTPVLPKTGEYMLTVHRRAMTGPYTLGITVGPTTAVTPTTTEYFVAGLGATVQPNDPQSGAGIIEPNATDVFQIDGESGDVVDIRIMHSDPTQRTTYFHGTPQTRACNSTDTQTLSWSLRDPRGTVIFASDPFNDLVNKCVPTDTGALVLGLSGTYTLAVSGATRNGTYDLQLTQPPRLREAAQPGQEPPPAALSNVDPAQAAPGGMTTVSIYGTNMPRPTAVRLTNNNTHASIPVTLTEAHAVRSRVPALTARARIDLTNTAVAVPGAYTLTVDGGGQAPTRTFSVIIDPGANSAIELTATGLTSLRSGAVNRGYVQLTNPRRSDMFARLTLPVPAAFNAHLLQSIDVAPLLEALRTKGFTDTQLAGVTARMLTMARLAPQPLPGGEMALITDLFIPAGGSVIVALEIVPPFGDIEAFPNPTAAAITAQSPTAAATPERCDTTHTISKAVGIDSVTRDESGATDKLASWARQFLHDLSYNLPDPIDNYYDQAFPPKVQDALANLFATVAVTALTVPELIGTLIGTMWAYADSGGNLASDKLDQVLDFVKSLAAQEALGELLGELGDAIDKIDLTLDFVWTAVCDPNALTGPGTKTEIGTAPGNPNVKLFEGSPVHAGDRVPYVAEFENVGDQAVRKVTVEVPLSRELDPTTLQVSDVRVGTTDVMLHQVDPRDPWRLRGEADVPINGATNRIAVDSVFVPNLCNDVVHPCANSGQLVVSYYGIAPTFDSFGPIDGHSAFLPKNVNAPEGQGFFTFSAKVKNTISVGAPVYQPHATIRFDPHQAFPPAPIDTNAWQNKVEARPWSPGDHLVPAAKFALKDKPGSPKSRSLTLDLRDPSLQSVPNPATTGVTVVVKSDLGATQTYLLPAGAGWKSSGTGKYTYKDSQLLNGPIKSATFDVRSGRIKLAGKGVKLLHSLTPMPTWVAIRIEFGTDRVCATTAGGIVRPVAGKSLLSVRAPAPGSCVG